MRTLCLIECFFCVQYSRILCFRFFKAPGMPTHRVHVIQFYTHSLRGGSYCNLVLS